MHYWQLFSGYSKQYLKKLLAYRGDFFAQFFADLMSQIMSLVLILVIFRQIPRLNGWNEGEMLFLYGFFLLPYALFNVFFSNFFEVPRRYILQGELDRVLVRPAPSLFQVMLEQIELESALSLVSGFLVLLYGAKTAGLDWSWWHFPVLILTVTGGTLIYGGIFIALASLAFWFEGNIALMPTMYNISVYGRYPVTVYRGIVRFILTFILPFAFTGYFPAALLLGKKEGLTGGILTPLVGLVVFLIGVLIWNRGIRRYTGAGN